MFMSISGWISALLKIRKWNTIVSNYKYACGISGISLCINEISPVMIDSGNNIRCIKE